MATTGTQIAHQLIAIVLAVVVRIHCQVDAEEAVINNGLMQLHTVARIRYGSMAERCGVTGCACAHG